MEDIYNKNNILKLIKRVNLYEYKIIHSKTVANLAVNIAKNAMKVGYPICIQSIEAGAMLHDIGIAKTLDDASPNHSSIGAEIARENGYCDKVARCIEAHEYVIWTKEEGKLFDMEMSRESFRPESWEERIVSYADAVVFVYSEVAREKDYWEDPRCLQKAAIPYWRKVFQKYSLGEFEVNHPFIQRLYEQQKNMLQYVKPEFFRDPEYIKLDEQMKKAQIDFGLKVPFAYEENL